MNDFIITMIGVLISIQAGMTVARGLRKRIKILDIFTPVYVLIAGIICGTASILVIFWPISLAAFILLAVVLSG